MPSLTANQNGGSASITNGSSTILAGNTSRSVSHGMGVTPEAIVATARGVEAVAVTARNALTFTVSRAGSTGSLAFDWIAAGEYIPPDPSLYDPLTSIGWHAAFWAEDPAWTAPAEGGQVAQWDDGTGNGRHLTQSSSTKRPLYRATGLGGRPALQFSGGQVLKTATWTGLAQPWSLVVIADAALADHRGYITDGWGSSNRAIIQDSGSTWGFYAGSSYVYAGDATVQGPRLFIATANGSGSVLEVDEVVGTTGNAGSHTMAGLTVGSENSGTLPTLQGYVTFAGVLNRALSTDEKAELRAWSQARYGTP